MLNKLLRTRRSISVDRPRVPTGERIYAVGDIHGCDRLLGDLLVRIDADDAARTPVRTSLIFLGDLVDRGAQSAAVVERLRRLAIARPDVRFLTGNHEEIFLGAVEGEPKALRLFCRIGGRETIMSYGMSADEYERLDYEEFAGRLQTLVPAEHRTFIAGFEDMITIGDYTFVHAGVRPDTALDAQRRNDLRWIRDPFLDHPRPLARMIVHGHTITDAVEERPHRIGVDTGAYCTGRLTALGLEGDARWTIQTDGSVA